MLGIKDYKSRSIRFCLDFPQIHKQAGSTNFNIKQQKKCESLLVLSATYLKS